MKQLQTIYLSLPFVLILLFASLGVSPLLFSSDALAAPSPLSTIEKIQESIATRNLSLFEENLALEPFISDLYQDLLAEWLILEKDLEIQGHGKAQEGLSFLKGMQLEKFTNQIFLEQLILTQARPFLKEHIFTQSSEDNAAGQNKQPSKKLPIKLLEPKLISEDARAAVIQTSVTLPKYGSIPLQLKALKKEGNWKIYKLLNAKELAKEHITKF